MPKPLVYGQPHMTLQEVASVLGISATAVRRIEQEALAKLRRRGKDLRAFLRDSDDKPDYTIYFL